MEEGPCDVPSPACRGEKLAPALVVSSLSNQAILPSNSEGKGLGVTLRHRQCRWVLLSCCFPACRQQMLAPAQAHGCLAVIWEP